jgi:hypothetical protein
LFNLTIPYADSTVAIFKPVFFVGPTLAVKLSAKGKFQNAGNSRMQDLEVKNTDLGLVFGGGVVFYIGERIVTLNIRKVIGLSSIDESIQKIDVKNDVISVMVGYLF